MEWSDSYYYYILAGFVSVVLPFSWEGKIRGLILPILNQTPLVKAWNPKYKILSFFYYRYKITTFALVVLGIIIGFFGIILD